ncbi:hypothetical protein JL722_15162 [Aureococcus anophagefferens]|nr:hypothetical protein JL722_15162 [Aureococcus anophagefferens]
MACRASSARLSGFVAMTCSMGFAATGAPVLTADAALATYGVFATSACANTLNQIYEIPRLADGADTRPPLPSGRCSTPEALAFAGVTSVSGVAALATLSPTAAALASRTSDSTPGPTMLKPRSEWNTWVGAAVGAVPPLIGWAAAGGSLVGGGEAHAAALAASNLEPLAAAAATLGATPAEPWLLAGILYLWQFPHFFALAWVHKADYAKGGFAMVPTRLKDEGDADARAPPTLGNAVRRRPRPLCLHELLPRDEAPSAVVPPLCPVGPKKKTAGADDTIK